MTLSVVASRSYVPGAPQILIKVTATNSAPNAVPNNSSVAVTRIHPNGSRWAVITDADPRIAGGSWTWLDTLAPYNIPVRYEVRTAGVTATSGTTFLPSNKAWLLSPQQAGLAFEIDGIKEIAERTAQTRSGRFEPIGAEAIYLTDGRRNGISGALTLRVPVRRETNLRFLLASDSMVLINTPGTTGWDIGWLWVQPTSVTYSNPANLVSHPFRTVTVQFEQGAQPFADFVPVWTSGSAAAFFAANNITSAGVVSRYADSAALVTNTRV